MVLKKTIIFLFLFVFATNNFANSSQILDYETEVYFKSLINKIKKINDIKREINFRILSDQSINAFVDENEVINITSALIEHSPDYVAILSVLSHEIGHIDGNHIKIRKSKMKDINNFKEISNLSIIAGSMISGNPELLQGVALSAASSSNTFINFSKEQETEADIYSLNTLKKLNIQSDSIVNLLKIIEKNALKKGLTKEKQRTSTHPYFEDRIDLIKYINQNKENKFDIEDENKFKFIQAKFLGYNSNATEINKLKEPYKTYANSILDAKNGNLYESLIKLNLLIKNDKNNIYFIETKADILFSYGYTKESIYFYEIVLKKLPNNLYAQIRKFSNYDYLNLTTENKNKLFSDNFNLIMNFYNNKNIILTYLKLAKQTRKEDWINFLEFWIKSEKNNNDNIKKDLEIFIKTKDKDLVKLINKIYDNL